MQESSHAAGSVYPPSFCNLQLMLAVMIVAQLSVFMVGLGRLDSLDLRWLLRASAYGQSLALFCVVGLCVTRPWLRSATPRGAWVLTWLLSLALTLAWSYAIGVIATVLGFGPGRDELFGFMLQSLMAVALVSFALLRYLLIRSQWRAQVTAQADARVQALQARIRPHFLFNSLNTIASLIPEQPGRAERAIEDLADLFRGSMRRADRLIDLADELELARKYLDMEQNRLGDRLQVDWRVEDLPARAQVLPMILQPVLENAVGHGLQQLPGGGLITVYGRDEGGNLVITVSNPLPGAGAEPVRRDRHHGMALSNIRSRLQLAYGDRASLVAHPDEGTFFTILTFPHVTRTDR